LPASYHPPGNEIATNTRGAILSKGAYAHGRVNDGTSFFSFPSFVLPILALKTCW